MEHHRWQTLLEERRFGAVGEKCLGSKPQSHQSCAFVPEDHVGIEIGMAVSWDWGELRGTDEEGKSQASLVAAMP